MIKNVIDLLNSSDWLIGDEDIDIAKGKNKAPINMRELKESIKRNRINKVNKTNKTNKID